MTSHEHAFINGWLLGLYTALAVLWAIRILT
jgi:hypothetical protein